MRRFVIVFASAWIFVFALMASTVPSVGSGFAAVHSFDLSTEVESATFIAAIAGLVAADGGIGGGKTRIRSGSPSGRLPHMDKLEDRVNHNYFARQAETVRGL